MKKSTVKIIPNGKSNIAQILSTSLDKFERISTSKTEVFITDINKIRIDSTMMVMIHLNMEDAMTYELRIICGGGKMNNVIQYGYGAESSELKRFEAIIYSLLEDNGFTILKPGEDYYGNPLG